MDRVSIPYSTPPVVEFILIGSLADLLDKSPTHTVEPYLLPVLLRQCLYALEYRHKHGINHGNIRPESVLVQSCNPLRVKLYNISYTVGVFQPLSKQGLSDTSVGAVTSLHVDRQPMSIDIWALGILALPALRYLSRKLPASPFELESFLGLPCMTLVKGMLELDRRHRLSATDCLRDPWLQRQPLGKRRLSESVIGDVRSAKKLKTIADPVGDQQC